MAVSFLSVTNAKHFVGFGKADILVQLVSVGKNLICN